MDLQMEGSSGSPGPTSSKCDMLHCFWRSYLCCVDTTFAMKNLLVTTL